MSNTKRGTDRFHSQGSIIYLFIDFSVCLHACDGIAASPDAVTDVVEGVDAGVHSAVDAVPGCRSVARKTNHAAPTAATSTIPRRAMKNLNTPLWWGRPPPPPPPPPSASSSPPWRPPPPPSVRWPFPSVSAIIASMPRQMSAWTMRKPVAETEYRFESMTGQTGMCSRAMRVHLPPAKVSVARVPGFRAPHYMHTGVGRVEPWIRETVRYGQLVAGWVTCHHPAGPPDRM